MPNAQETETENVFDENGQAVETEADDGEADTENVESEAEEPAGEKYRIGDKEFASQKEALAYAQQLEADKQVADAYQRGLRDGVTSTPPAGQSVTPPAEDDTETEELYTNPKAFLNKFATKIKNETRAELDQKEAVRSQSNQIWREFTERHPALADFRSDIESFVEQNQEDVRALIAAKGKPAGYDYIATKMKARFAQYAEALKPKRSLPNSSADAPPATKSISVTPKKEENKPLSFYEQLRKIRKRG